MVVLEGSDAALKPASSLTGGAVALRQMMIASGVLESLNEKLIFRRDHMFKTPSQAAGIVTGYSINGRDNWKLDDGTTFKQYFESGLDLI
jgi:hypothetical protein